MIWRETGGKLLLASVIAFSSPAMGAETIPGPVAASVVKVIDGDTLDVSVKVWIGQDTRTRVRIRGIDAPELHARCPAEKAGALAAKARLKELVGTTVTLTAIGQDKYAGRVDAKVTATDGSDVAAILIREKLVRPYGGGKRGSWCG